MNQQTFLCGTKSEGADGQSSRFYRPNVDIIERQDSLVVHAELPGSRAEDIRLEVKDGKLELRASVEKHSEERGRLLKSEYGIGDFYRSFELADSIDTENIQANYRDGILTLHLPKTAAAKPRTIKVEQA